MWTEGPPIIPGQVLEPVTLCNSLIFLTFETCQERISWVVFNGTKTAVKAVPLHWTISDEIYTILISFVPVTDKSIKWWSQD